MTTTSLRVKPRLPKGAGRGWVMALYRYFPNKEALMDAAVDAAMGTPPARSGPREGWRQEVKHRAHAKRAMLCSRPWLAELPFVAAPHGPNWLSWHEAFLQAIADRRACNDRRQGGMVAGGQERQNHPCPGRVSPYPGPYRRNRCH